MSKLLIPLIIISIIAGIVGILGFQFFTQITSIPDNSPSGEYIFEVQTGDNLSIIADKLEEDNVISNKSFLLWVNNGVEIQDLQIGTYTLDLPDDAEGILKQINAQTEELNSVSKDTVRVTLKEGQSADQVIETLAEAGLGEVDELANFIQNPENFNSEVYQFLPQTLNCQYGDMFSCQKYYLEGYIYPDTYEFFVNSSPAQIFAKILNNFQVKVWNKLLPNEKTNLDKAVIMASVIEKETGRPISGVNASNIDELNLERAKVARVFYNRIEENIGWQSDVTVQFGTGRKLCQQTFEIPDCIYLDSPQAQHLYNTYLNKGYPIGAISSPQFDSIKAALNPAPGNFLFFVADLRGVTYFAENGSGHQQNIRQVQAINAEINN